MKSVIRVPLHKRLAGQNRSVLYIAHECSQHALHNPDTWHANLLLHTCMHTHTGQPSLQPNTVPVLIWNERHMSRKHTHFWSSCLWVVLFQKPKDSQRSGLARPTPVSRSEWLLGTIAVQIAVEACRLDTHTHTHMHTRARTCTWLHSVMHCMLW